VLGGHGEWCPVAVYVIWRTDESLTGSRSHRKEDIVGVTWVNSHDMACAWYRNGKVSCGRTDDLGSVRAPYDYSLPSGYKPRDILSIAWLDSEERACAWYKNGKVSCGPTYDLDSNVAPLPFTPHPGRNELAITWVDRSRVACAFDYYGGYFSCGNIYDLDSRIDGEPFEPSKAGGC
jgi:hypothetical protein